MRARVTGSIPSWLIASIAMVALPLTAFAWKPNTHVYIANLILADAYDGKVWIPPFGEFSISPEASNALSFPDSFRAGAVGPDGFPDVFTGQLSIHPNTDGWLTYMWNVMRDEWRTSEGWAFLFGFLTHCGGDMWCHDWVNYYAGGPWQGLSEFESASDPSACALIDARHLAIEATLNRQVHPITKSIRLPTCEFVYKYLVIDPQARALGICPLVDRYVGKYWEKYPSRDKSLSYDAAWFEDLELGLKEWVAANETAWKEVIEEDEGMIGSLIGNLGLWALNHILDMEGLPSVTRWTAEAVVAAVNLLPDSIKWALDLIGIDEQTLQHLEDEFVDALLVATTDMTAEQWDAAMNGAVNSALFSAQTLAQIQSDMGWVPLESEWVHSNGNPSQFADFINRVNGPLYNSVITGKLALLPPSEIDRLTGGNFYTVSGTPNVLLGLLRSIDQSRQWADGLHPWWLGFGIPLSTLKQRPAASTFYYLFKPYPPIQQYSVGPLYSPTRPPPAILTKVTGWVAKPDGALLREAKILWRKASDSTGPWQSMGTASDGTFEWTFPPDFQTTDYLLRAVHSRYNFAGPVLMSHTSPSINQPLELKAASAVPTPSVGPRGAGSARRNAYVTYDCVPSAGELATLFGTAGNSIGLPSSFPLKLGNCRVLKTTAGPVADARAYLTGMTGKVFVIGGSTYSWSIVPPRETVYDFTIDLDGNARWGATSLHQAMGATDTLTVNVGSHPGTLAVEVMLDWSATAVAGARISHAYRAIRNALSDDAAGQLSTAEEQAIRSAIDRLPQTIGDPATAEADMRTAISKVADAQLRQTLGTGFDIALGQFPALAPGEQWPLLWDELRCSVQPNVTGADSSAVAPTFAAAASRPRYADTLRPSAARAPAAGAPADLAQKPAPTAPAAPSGTRVDGAPATTPAAPSNLRLEAGSPAAAPPATTPAAPSTVRTADAAPKVFGVEHTVGRERPIKLILNGAELSAVPVRYGDELVVPVASEKLLVIHLTLRNPSPEEELGISGGTLTFVAATLGGSRSEPQDWLCREKTDEWLDTLLPANGKLDAYAVITLPAKGGVDRLIISGDSGSSVEIDLSKALKPLPAALADPKDPSGYSALPEVTASMNETCQLGSFSVRVEKAQYSTGPILKQVPAKGARFLTLELNVTNRSYQELPVHWGDFFFTLRLADGREIAWNGELLLSGKDQEIDQMLGPGKQLSARLFFEVPSTAEPGLLYAREGKDGRAYLVKLEGVK